MICSACQPPAQQQQQQQQPPHPPCQAHPQVQQPQPPQPPSIQQQQQLQQQPQLQTLQPPPQQQPQLQSLQPTQQQKPQLHTLQQPQPQQQIHQPIPLSLPPQQAQHPQQQNQIQHQHQQICNNYHQTNHQTQMQPSDACSSIVQSLLVYSCAGADSFVRRAIESLVRKIKDKQGELDALITAVTTSGSIPTPCVTIQRTLDGRLQVAGRKGFPHIVYAKIWRWPDLNRCELRPTGNCVHSYLHDSDLVCVNPYHYERIVGASGIEYFDYDCQNSIENYAPQDPYCVTPLVDEVQNIQSIHNPQNNLNIQNNQNIPNIRQENWRPIFKRPQLPTWCSIAYFELDQQIGAPFEAESKYSTITIDGYTNGKAPDRFCLGFMSSQHRAPEVEKVRLSVGKGVQLSNVASGDVFLTNVSNVPVFLSSPFLDYVNLRPVGDAVHKIYPGAEVKVFDLNYTYDLMTKKAVQAKEEAEQTARQIIGPSYVPGSAPTPSIGVDELRRLGVISLSFIKGWGQDYRRKSLKECPCWVEINLHQAFEVSDDVLQL